MYLTPGMLFKTFDWESKSSEIDGRGKAGLKYTPAGQIQGVLSETTAQQKLQFQQMSMNVTHQIVSQGAPQAKSEDRLILDGRHFYVLPAENPGNLGLWTIYMCEERNV